MQEYLAQLKEAACTRAEEQASKQEEGFGVGYEPVSRAVERRLESILGAAIIGGSLNQSRKTCYEAGGGGKARVGEGGGDG